MQNLTYKDFAMDELMYFTDAYNNGMRYNAMVGQAQRICECLLKHVISKRLVNNNEVMKQHNLRVIYEYCTDMLNLPIQSLHTSVMQLNNFYTHTRYPGREAFLASRADIEAAFESLSTIVKGLKEFF